VEDRQRCVVGGVAEGGGRQRWWFDERGGEERAGRRTLSLSQVHDRLENAKLAAKE